MAHHQQGRLPLMTLERRLRGAPIPHGEIGGRNCRKFRKPDFDQFADWTLRAPTASGGGAAGDLVGARRRNRELHRRTRAQNVRGGMCERGCGRRQCAVVKLLRIARSVLGNPRAAMLRPAITSRLKTVEETGRYFATLAVEGAIECLRAAKNGSLIHLPGSITTGPASCTDVTRDSSLLPPFEHILISPFTCDSSTSGVWDDVANLRAHACRRSCGLV